MSRSRHPHGILVPVIGGDISRTVLADARAALAHDDDAHLILLHVPVDAHAPVAPHDVPRWRRLADAVPASRVFVDVAGGAGGDANAAIAGEAERFHCDRVLRDPEPEPAC